MQDNKKEGGLWISPEIYGLNINEGLKMLLAKIDNLNNDERGCFASDEHLGFMQGKSTATIQKRLLHLENLELIERLNVNGKRSIRTTLKVNSVPHRDEMSKAILKNEYRTTQKRVSTLLKNEYRNKETKEELKNRESALAFSFLKSNYNNRFNAWEKAYRFRIRQYDKFILDYNDTVVLKSIPFDADKLFDFLCRYANGFIKNDDKHIQ